MDFKELMQKMQHIEEGLAYDPSIDECGMDMPAAIIQGGHPPEESLNMNLTINSKGAGGIRELIDVLKGIGGDGEPKDEPYDDDSEIVIGDNYENSVDNDAGPHTYGVDAVTHQGDNPNGKLKGIKVNGGENPLFHESLVNHLASLYEEVKGRTLLSEISPDAFIARGGKITYLKSNGPKERAKLQSGQHVSGYLNSANATLPPNHATKHVHVNVASKKGEITPDWEDRLNSLAALGNKDRARKAAERDAKDRA